MIANEGFGGRYYGCNWEHSEYYKFVCWRLPSMVEVSDSEEERE